MKTTTKQIINFIICLPLLYCTTNTHAQWRFLGEQKFSSGAALARFDFTISDGIQYVVYSNRTDNDNVNVMKQDGDEWVDVGSD